MAPDAQAFFVERGLGDPHWQVVARPARFDERRMGRSDARRFREEAYVSLRGWPFPYISRDHDVGFDDGIESLHLGEFHREAHRIYRSGLFIWRGTLWEESEGKLAGRLTYVGSIWALTEYTLFVSRFFEVAGIEDDVALSIELTGLRGRRLWESRGILGFGYVGQAERFHEKVQLSMAELRARPDEIAISCDAAHRNSPGVLIEIPHPGPPGAGRF